MPETIITVRVEQLIENFTKLFSPCEQALIHENSKKFQNLSLQSAIQVILSAEANDIKLIEALENLISIFLAKIFTYRHRSDITKTILDANFTLLCLLYIDNLKLRRTTPIELTKSNFEMVTKLIVQLSTLYGQTLCYEYVTLAKDIWSNFTKITQKNGVREKLRLARQYIYKTYIPIFCSTRERLPEAFDESEKKCRSSINNQFFCHQVFTSIIDVQQSQLEELFFIIEKPLAEKLLEEGLTQEQYLWEKTIRELSGSPTYYFNKKAIDSHKIRKLQKCLVHKQMLLIANHSFKEILPHHGFANPVLRGFLSEQFHQGGILQIVQPLLTKMFSESISDMDSMLKEFDKDVYITPTDSGNKLHVKITSYLARSLDNLSIPVESRTNAENQIHFGTFTIEYKLTTLENKVICEGITYDIGGKNQRVIEVIKKLFQGCLTKHQPSRTNSAPSTPEMNRRERVYSPSKYASAPTSPVKPYPGIANPRKIGNTAF